jgi:hypothetical protein
MEGVFSKATLGMPRITEVNIYIQILYILGQISSLELWTLLLRQFTECLFWLYVQLTEQR